MTANYYDSDRAVAEYLLFHYGTPEQVLPHGIKPSDALYFPIRCVTECLEARSLPLQTRALDLGCAVGRSTFELARYCGQVIGIDSSQKFIDTARHLQEEGFIEFSYADEGDLSNRATVFVPAGDDRYRVTFQHGDAQNLPEDLGVFDVVLMANLIDRLSDPRRCLRRLSTLMRSGGQLIITSPYTWTTEYTPKENWLGGFERDSQRVKTIGTLKELLAPDFHFSICKDLPFLIREHTRKFQWSVAEASAWVRK